MSKKECDISNHRGQIKISFGMIFSMFLIIIFLAVAFYAIRTFFGLQDSAQVGVFVNDFQRDIDRIWRSTESSQIREYNLPGEVEYICFIDFEVPMGGDFSYLYSELKFYDDGDKNMIFYPVDSVNLEGAKIENVNLDLITATDNPNCIEVSNGKVDLKLDKGFGEALVNVQAD